jgi:hypothetical protein
MIWQDKRDGGDLWRSLRRGGLASDGELLSLAHVAQRH